MTVASEIAEVIGDILGKMHTRYLKLCKEQIQEAVITNQNYQMLLSELELLKAEMKRYNDRVEQTSLV